MNYKKTLKLPVVILILSIIMFISYSVAFAIVPVTIKQLSPEESRNILPYLFGVCFFTTLALSYPIIRSRWHGWKLIFAMIFVLWGVQTLQATIEAVFFGEFIDMSAGVSILLAVQAFIRTIIFIPIAVLLLGKMKKDNSIEEIHMQFTEKKHIFVMKIGLLSVVFLCIYFFCGYFIAFRSSVVREFYDNGTGISNSLLMPLQIARGFLWVMLALPVIKMLRGKKWENALILGIIFSIIHSIGLIMPNPFMPTTVRLVHFVELMISLFSFGAITGYFLTVREKEGQIEPGI